MSGEERIADAFAHRKRRAALMPYLLAGYPTVEGSQAVGRACVEAGADLVELGVPYSDPLADGPVIHAAATEALRRGSGLPQALSLTADLAPHLPVVLMVYANLVLARGVDRFVGDLVAAGASGLIVPDLPPEEAGELKRACTQAGLALVMLVTPTTNGERLSRIAKVASGFLYAVSVVGTTGERPPQELQYGLVVAAARGASRLPVAVGFGIATARHAALALEAGADGVIVGSRLVRAAGEGREPGSAVAAALAEIASGLAG